MKMKIILLTSFVVAFCFASIGQTNTEKTSVYFSSGDHHLSKKEKKSIDDFLSQVTLDEGCKLRIYGYTDSDGDAAFNEQLSTSRCKEVLAYLNKNGWDDSSAEIAAYGEKVPLGDNSTETGKQENRRTDIFIDCRVRDAATKPTAEIKTPKISPNDLSLDTLFQLLAEEPQSFNIDPTIDNFILCDGGSRLYFPANSFSINDAEAKQGVTIKVTEVFNKSDMVLNNMGTAAGNGILESGGMLDISAYVGDKKVGLKKNKKYTAFIPTDNPDDRMSLFNGKRKSNRQKTTHWKQDSYNYFGLFDGAGYLNCGSTRTRDIRYNKRCRLICRIRTSIQARRAENKAPDGMTELNVADNQPKFKFKSCRYGAEMRGALGIENAKLINDSLWASEYKKYNVTNYKDYVEAYQQSRNKMATTMNYAFSSSNLGMVNCDFFMSVPAEKKIDVIAQDTSITPTYMCMVFNNHNAMMVGTEGDQMYGWLYIPRDEPVTMVGIRYKNGKIYSAIKSLTTGEEVGELSYEQISKEELKKRLQKLDVNRNANTAMR